MSHLSAEEFVDLTDGVLSAARARHLDDCRDCRERAESLRDALGEARAIEVPEPSPLFWDHLSRRVREAVARDADPGWRAWSWWRSTHAWSLRAVVSVVAAVLAVVVGFWVLPPLAESPVTVVDRLDTGDLRVDAAPAVRGHVADSDSDADNDAEWLLLLAMVDAVEWQDIDTDGLVLDRDALDGVVFLLSADERREIGRLLRAELGSAGTGSL